VTTVIKTVVPSDLSFSSDRETAIVPTVAAVKEIKRTHAKTASLTTLSVLFESEKIPQITFQKVSGGSETEPLGKASDGLDSGIPAFLVASSSEAKLSDSSTSDGGKFQ
jgi:hypothetical protein